MKKEIIEGDTVLIKRSGFCGTLLRLRKSERAGGGPWLVVGQCGTCQPQGGKRAMELIYRPSDGDRGQIVAKLKADESLPVWEK